MLDSICFIECLFRLLSRLSFYAEIQFLQLAPVIPLYYQPQISFPSLQFNFAKCCTSRVMKTKNVKHKKC